MGRTNGRLVNYIQKALKFKLYFNLVYEEDGSVFSLDLPRYHPEMNTEYCRILKDWYKINPHLKFKTYSDAKAVLKANLKKSVYYLSLPSHGKKLRFRLATKEETAIKRKQQKEKSPVHEDPPSVGSSGYHSAETDDERYAICDQTISDQNIEAQLYSTENGGNVDSNTGKYLRKIDF